MADVDLDYLEKIPSGGAILVGGTEETQYVIAKEGKILKMFKVIEEK